MKNAIIALMVLAAIAAVFMVERWRWNGCRKVGHGVFYCLTKSK